MSTLVWSILFYLLISTSIVSGDCPNGFVRHDDSCYKLFINVKATWVEALMYCKLFNAHLAVIETDREQNYIEGLIRSAYGGSTFVWLGASDALVEGEWQWVETGQDIIRGQTYTKWSPGEPNSRGQQGEDCLDIHRGEKFQWNDSNCGLMYNFLCERARRYDYLYKNICTKDDACPIKKDPTDDIT